MASSTTRRGVIRWDSEGDRAAVAQPIAAVLPSRTSPHRIAKMVELLYAERGYSPAEMLDAFRQGGQNPYPARFGTGEIDDPSGTQW